MDRLIYFRIAGSSIVLSMLVYHLSVSALLMERMLPLHPELQQYNDVQFRYFTIWNCILQMTYQILSLICDLSTLYKKGDSLPPSGMHRFRLKIFHELICPVASGVLMFWPLFLYDRDLILPVTLDLTISSAANYVIHGLVIVYILWELVLLPGDVPKKKDVKMTYMLIYLFTFTTVMLWTRFVDLGTWLYPYMNLLEGPPRYLFFCSIQTVSIIMFCNQWRIRELIWKVINGIAKSYHLIKYELSGKTTSL